MVLIIFLNFLVDTCLFVGPLIPLFWTSSNVSSGSQSQSWQSYSHLVKVYVMCVPWIHRWCNTCWPLVASMAAELFSSTYLRTSIVGVQDWNLCCRCLTVWDQADVQPIELCRLGPTKFYLTSLLRNNTKIRRMHGQIPANVRRQCRLGPHRRCRSHEAKPEGSWGQGVFHYRRFPDTKYLRHDETLLRASWYDCLWTKGTFLAGIFSNLRIWDSFRLVATHRETKPSYWNVQADVPQ